MADSVHDGDKVSLNGPPSVPSGTGAEVTPIETKIVETKPMETKPANVKPTELPVVVQNGDVGLEAADTTAPAALASPVAPNSAIVPPVPIEVKDDKSGSTMGEHKTEVKPEKPQEIKGNGIENGEKEEATEKADELQVGDKRKAVDEISAINTSNGAAAKTDKLHDNDTEIEKDADGESSAKKQKTETNGNVAKRGPGRPKSGTKTEKKVKIPSLGKAARKTRSQDKMT